MPHVDEVTDFVTPQTQEDQTAFSIKLPQAYPAATHDQYNQMYSFALNIDADLTPLVVQGLPDLAASL